jgi:hypothetical protein
MSLVSARVRFTVSTFSSPSKDDMKPKQIEVEGVVYLVDTRVLSQIPLAFAIDVRINAHSEPVHSHTVTAHNPPSLEQLQLMLDAQRQRAAETAHRKLQLSSLLRGLE